MPGYRRYTKRSDEEFKLMQPYSHVLDVYQRLNRNFKCTYCMVNKTLAPSNQPLTLLDPYIHTYAMSKRYSGATPCRAAMYHHWSSQSFPARHIPTCVISAGPITHSVYLQGNARQGYCNYIIHTMQYSIQMSAYARFMKGR